MSLQLAAQHLASKGRGPDTTLVHMAPGEVRSLQAIAKAHGGSLTVNPDTGLPEAGFLSSILPMIAGVGLTAMSGGALSPVMAGLLTGGVTGVATGNLGKGLMAGLGAYGGAGLGSALAGAGAQNAILQANPGMAASEIARASVEPGFVQPSMTDKMLAGVKGLGSEAGRDAFMQSVGGAKGLFKSGYTAALPMMLAQSGETARPPSTASSTPYSSEYIPGYTGAGPSRDSSESRYFMPRFKRMADGGDTGMTGQSDDYYRYLMGLAPAPRPYTPEPVAPAATQADTAPLTVTNPMAARRYDTYSDSMSPDDPNNPLNPNAWGNLTPIQQAAFYAANPPYAAATQALQNFWGATTLGQIQAALDPTGVGKAQSIANPGPGGYLSLLDHAMLGISPPAGPGKTPSNPSLTGGLLNFSGTQAPAPVDIAVPTISNEQAAQMMADEINASLGMTPTAPAPAQTPDVVVGGPIAGGVPTGTNIGMIDANIGIDPSGMGGMDPGLAAADAAIDVSADAAAADGQYARGGLSSLAAFANGGYNLGDYSDGGRLLRGPGDGVSDSIPASIADKRPARLADGEFVVPARIVSELGNGSTEAGARKLYAMMDRVQKNRAKTTGKGKVAVNSRSEKYLPA